MEDEADEKVFVKGLSVARLLALSSSSEFVDRCIRIEALEVVTIVISC